MTTAQEGFESAQFLVGWAKSQFDELDKLVQAFNDADPTTVVEELDEKTRWTLLKVRFKPVPHRVRGLANNIVKDLRDALDQATSAACLRVTGKFKRNCHFPFAANPDDLERVFEKQSTCKDIPAALYPVLRSFEPYETGDGHPGGNNTLRLLGRVSGPHKHRFTLRAAPTAGPWEISNISHEWLTPANGVVDLGFTETKSGDWVFARVCNAEVQLDMKLTSFVAFADTKLKGISVTRFLSECLSAVGKIVQDLETEASKLAIKAG